jgi:hypothetical protein
MSHAKALDSFEYPNVLQEPCFDASVKLQAWLSSASGRSPDDHGGVFLDVGIFCKHGDSPRRNG